MVDVGARLREILYVPTSALDCAWVLARKHLFFGEVSGSVDALENNDDTDEVLELNKENGDLDDLLLSVLGTSVTVQVLVETSLQSELFLRDFFPCLHFSQFASKLSLLPNEFTLEPLPFLDLPDEPTDLELDCVSDVLQSTPDKELSTDVVDPLEPLLRLCFVKFPFEDTGLVTKEHAEDSAPSKEVELSDTNDDTDAGLLSTLTSSLWDNDRRFCKILLSLCDLFLSDESME